MILIKLWIDYGYISEPHPSRRAELNQSSLDSLEASDSRGITCTNSRQFGSCYNPQGNIVFGRRKLRK
jgi:hypothetical protein